jgi:hypothetical protein
VLGEIAKTIGDSLGYGTVAINLLRPAWDDFEVVAVHRAEEERRRSLISGSRSSPSASTNAVPT